MPADDVLPVAVRGGTPAEAGASGADGWLLVAGEGDDALLERYGEAGAIGLECVVEIRDEDELERVLAELDPEIVLLSPDYEELDGVARVLELLSDLPAGKLAIAALAAPTSEDLAALNGPESMQRSSTSSTWLPCLGRDTNRNPPRCRRGARRRLRRQGRRDDKRHRGARHDLPESVEGGLAEACERCRRNRLLPGLDARAGGRPHQRHLQERPLGDKDHSYLVSFLWLDQDAGVTREVHLNFRGYPGRTTIPSCQTTRTVEGKTVHGSVPCFADRGATKRLGSITATAYTVNQGIDEWHVLYLWRHGGSLYTVWSTWCRRTRTRRS